MGGVETGPIESIIAKVRLLPDVGWGPSEGSWDRNEEPTEIPGERDKGMRRNDGSWRGTGDYLWTGKAAMGCAGALCPIWGGAKPGMANTWKLITHKILLNLTIESHKKLTMSMLIVDIKHHEAILSKFWMNKNEILLNMKHDTIVFSDQLNTSISIFLISSNTKHSSWLQSTLISSAAYSKIFKMLKHSVSFFQKKSFSI